MLFVVLCSYSKPSFNQIFIANFGERFIASFGKIGLRASESSDLII